MADKQKQILDYWFNDVDNHPDRLDECNELWWSHGTDIDMEVKKYFHMDVIAARNGGYQSWRKTPEGTLALILLLDQFSRHIYRDTANAYTGDAEALAIAQGGIIGGFDQELPFFQRAFYYLPFEHSEKIDKQETSLALYQKLADAADENNKEAANKFYQFAIDHYTIIQEYDRFPHRNEALNRDSNEDEIAFLETENSAF
ncbi:MAG: hypothetical protein COB66_08105 [Coxiella sp. (in: Bacteria)]|nr:MAG: hypothetical protein COB66_08105 [Coxiella sp. (in: g-proteobacteria)]